MKIWILNISHKHGNNFSAFTTREEAEEELYDYVSDEWDEGLSDQFGDLLTLTREEAIDAYFDTWSEALDPEYYQVEEIEIRTASVKL